MKHYGASIKVTEGTEIENLTAPSGTAFPDNANVSELFYRTDMGKLFVCTFAEPPVTWTEVTPTTVSDIDDITNVAISGSPAQGQFLQYDSISGKWENGIPGAGSVGSCAFAKLTTGSASFGNSVSGANLLPASTDGNTGTPLTGTWECLGEAGSPSYTTLWIRTS